MYKLLVIEDEPTILENIMETLMLEQFEVYGAKNGREGVEKALQVLPNLIICDIMMPELNGYGVLIELRNNPRTAAIPFVFLTAKAERDDMRRGMELGADDYITKPFTAPELLGAVKMRLERHTKVILPYEQQLDDLRQNIARALPHELRTPLTGIIGYTEMLMMGTDDMEPDQLQGMLGMVYKSGMRLYRVIENYLLYVQIDMATNDPKGMENLIQPKQISETRTVIPQAAIKAGDDMSRTPDLSLDVDPAMMRIPHTNLAKIVEELVQNAFKFSQPGAPVQVRGRADNGIYEITVTDQGRGMTEEQIAQIGAYMQFERKTYEQQGLGLGLTLAKRLTELHGGRIVVNSVPKEGTTVHVKLPVDREV
ncbi:MAG: response regulator [Anaerolineae bacterium]|nr:response regulator [Anaerolineae bacterium]